MYRDRLFIAEKTLERTREGVLKELDRSLDRLGVEYFDLYQMHALGEPTDIEKVFSPGGALEAFIEARDTGLTRYIGITGHRDMRILLKALKLFDFDSVLLPVNIASMTAPSPENDFRPILREAIERDIAVIAIKAIAKGRWKDERRYSTWYEPLDDPYDIDLAVWFTLSQEPVATYSLPCDVRLWPLVLDSAVRFRKLSIEEQAEAIEYAKRKGLTPLFPE
ncbi:MAG: aldo/keto reductase, partial [Candidatus Bathyarchaeia archaeon]